MLLANDARVHEVMKSLREVIKELAAKQPRAEDALDIDTSFEVKGGVVTMDRLIIAVHLLSARLMFHTVPEHWKTMLLGAVSNYVSSMAIKAGVTRATANLAKKIPAVGTIISLFQGVFSIPSRLLIQAKMEREIRKECADVRREMNKWVLSQKRKKSRVQDVSTRHFRQRLQKHWNGCKSK